MKTSTARAGWMFAAAALLASGLLLVATPAQAAVSSPAHCYGWPLEHVTAGFAAPGESYTSQIMVTDGSPCRDVNVRSVTADGRPTCRILRVHWGAEAGIATGPWTRVCAGWRVLWTNAREGDVFVIDVMGASATVGVRT